VDQENGITKRGVATKEIANQLAGENSLKIDSENAPQDRRYTRKR
jgi:hypothetical protein